MSSTIQNDTVTPLQCIVEFLVSGPIGQYISSLNSHPEIVSLHFSYASV